MQLLTRNDEVEDKIKSIGLLMSSCSFTPTVTTNLPPGSLVFMVLSHVGDVKKVKKAIYKFQETSERLV